ncbi:MAG TPA: hypothetical protein VGS10_19200 [Terracidiphilus sp.]|nr:hypothetical protein [Terracidiphilus sp.]HEV2464673.1 hypothetical protein [Acidobacteriaceae bacterium]
MKHLNEEELIELYYDEGTSAAHVHLRACRECSTLYDGMQRDLDSVKTAQVGIRGAEYGERVWQALSPQLIAYEKRPAHRLWWAQWKSAAVAAGCAALLATAFIGGRYWERHTNRTTAVVNANPPATQRVLLVVLTDHLDRTERLLVALNHADSSDRAENGQLQTEARELLASNRLYRATASKAGDPAMAAALDRVENVLAEMANDPNLTAEDLGRIRTDMNTEGILFDIRVLLARTPDQGSGPKPAKGASI